LEENRQHISLGWEMKCTDDGVEEGVKKPFKTSLDVPPKLIEEKRKGS